jgi:branched-chain amino acid transport system substrate-binding protein
MPLAAHPMTGEEPGFLRLSNMSQNVVPVRVGILLPFSNGSAATRALAAAMLKSAELALFDAGNPNILLITADEGSTPDQAVAGAKSLLAKGAEIIVGPLFSPSVTAIAPIARDRGVPVVAFSSDRAVGGQGVYLLSFQPENEVKRIVSYAASQGHSNFAALIPNNAYGDHIAAAFQTDVAALGGKISDIARYDIATGNVTDPAKAVADTKPDAVLIAQGGSLLKQMAPTLTFDGIDSAHVQLLGTGVWDDPSIESETGLTGGWFPAPAPAADDVFNAKYKADFGVEPPPLAALAYDAISLAALLAPGVPYHRFTPVAITDPNGFAGVDGIFRFNLDGTAERGLAVMGVRPDGFAIISPAPVTFQHQGS